MIGARLQRLEALAFGGGGGGGETPSGCEGSKYAPPSLTSMSSTAPQRSLPPVALALLGGLLGRTLQRRRRR